MDADYGSFMPIVRENLLGNEYRSICFSPADCDKLIYLNIEEARNKIIGNVIISYKLVENVGVYSHAQTVRNNFHQISFDKKRWNKFIGAWKNFFRCALHFKIYPKSEPIDVLIRLISSLIRKYMIEVKATPLGLDECFGKLFQDKNNDYDLRTRQISA